MRPHELAEIKPAVSQCLSVFRNPIAHSRAKANVQSSVGLVQEVTVHAVMPSNIKRFPYFTVLEKDHS